jgi:hypothetical protein
VAAPTFACTFAPAQWKLLPGFADYACALDRLASCADWPEVADYQALLQSAAPFVAEVGKLAAGLDASDIAGSYIARCVDGAVPSRRRNLHDLMNALVWWRFPLAKRALCRRQVALAVERGACTNRLRTRAQDRLAMVDEGGILVVGERRIVFGHAILEDAIRGRTSRGLPLTIACNDDDDDDDDAALDDAVAAAIAALPLPVERS